MYKVIKRKRKRKESKEKMTGMDNVSVHSFIIYRIKSLNSDTFVAKKVEGHQMECNRVPELRMDES